jgi:hypothetical protein
MEVTMSRILSIFYLNGNRVLADIPPCAAPDRATRKLMQEQSQRIEAARLCWACPF